ncbi:hypothetical protein [Sphingobium subterraneum]|uniref:Uncharacterized protein n=1 Tax=Sphingobium subterraneum TaxID=627688 RepID=A0A841J3W6_9SPHN|nr:hypothetical protein [Sphingobium subterraneum]MBB6122941.1 hypothetical protein [Sphingobium subterraneum]
MAGLSGCAVLYDARRDANATAVATAFDKAAPGTYFDDLRAAYATVGTREEDAALHLSEAGRDAQLLDAIAPASLSPDERKLIAGQQGAIGTAALPQLVEARFALLTGCGPADCGRIAPATLVAWRAFAVQYPSLVKAAADADDRLRLAADLAAEDGPVSADEAKPIPAACPRPGEPLPPLPAATPGMTPRQIALMNVRQTAGLIDACRDAPMTAFAGTSGTLGGLLRKIGENRAEQAKGEQAARDVKAAIAALEKEAKTPNSPSFLSDVAKLRDDLAKADLPAIAKAAGAEKLGTIIDDLLKVELQTSAAAAAPKTSATTAAAAPATDPSVTTKRAQAVLDLLGAAEQLVDAYKDMPATDRASALLVAKTAQQQQLDEANLAARHASDLAALDRQQLDAGLTELSYLASADLALRAIKHHSTDGATGLAKPDRAWFAQAAVAHGIAQSRGGMVAERLDWRRLQLERKYQVDLAERTAANRRALIAPLVQQIQAAGKTGIKPELVATLLGQLGVGAAVLGK